MNIAVVSTRQSTALTHATVRRAVAAEPTARVSVLDVDGSYPPGGIWANPDLGAAARLMLSVIDEPEVAAARGARAAADIAILHSPAAAGARIAAVLAESAPRRRARSRIALTARLEKVARRARATLR